MKNQYQALSDPRLERLVRATGYLPTDRYACAWRLLTANSCSSSIGAVIFEQSCRGVICTTTKLPKNCPVWVTGYVWSGNAIDDFGVVHALLERRTWLRRKSAGSSIAYQMIAANPDTVVIIQSCQFDFNLKRLQRYLVMVMDGGAEPCIVLTKTDLVDPTVLITQLAEMASAGITAPILPLSNLTGDGLDDLKRRTSFSYMC